MWDIIQQYAYCLYVIGDLSVLRIIRIGLLLLLKLYSNQPGYGMVVALRSACGLGFDYGGIVLPCVCSLHIIPNINKLNGRILN